MRPPLPSGRALALPRWRRQRAADLNAIAAAYGCAIVVVVMVFAAICFAEHGLAHRPMDFTAWVLIAFSGLMYLAVGGGVTALAVRRISTWPGRPDAIVSRGNALVVLFWPVTLAVLLLRAATAS